MGTANNNLAGAIVTGVISPVTGALSGFGQGLQQIDSAVPSGSSSGTKLLIVLILTAALLIGMKLAGVLVI